MIKNPVQEGQLWLVPDLNTDKLVGEDQTTYSTENILEIKPSAVYIPGYRKAIPVILSCYENNIPTYICTPVIGKDNLPSSYISALKSLSLPPLYGGFRPVNETDIELFKIQARLKGYKRTTERIKARISEDEIKSKDLKRLLYRINFVRFLDQSSLLKVLSYIHDPRWFIRDDAIKSTKLEQFFKLGWVKSSIDRYCNPAFFELLSTWYNSTKADNLSKYPAVKDSLTARDPIWKMWLKSFYMTDKSYISRVRACRGFLRFIFYNWLDVIYGKNDFFIAEKFFGKDEAAIAEWHKWVQQESSSLDHG